MYSTYYKSVPAGGPDPIPGPPRKAFRRMTSAHTIGKSDQSLFAASQEGGPHPQTQNLPSIVIAYASLSPDADPRVVGIHRRALGCLGTPNNPKTRQKEQQSGIVQYNWKLEKSLC